MPTCPICTTPAAAGARVCTVCGTSLPDQDLGLPTATVVLSSPERPAATGAPPAGLRVGQRFCPGCQSVYGPDYADSFCACGVELLLPPPELPPDPTELVVGKAEPERPPAGTPCLTLYSPDRQPVRYFPLLRDATLIGRLDATAGIFPEIDLDEWLEASAARKVSRQHALILRHRATGEFTLRPLAGNTGTQLEAEMILPLRDYPLRPGHRLVLGGAARLKFEIA
jgi:hypothetical protein